MRTQKLVCSLIVVVLWSAGLVYAQETPPGGSSDFVMPVIVDEKAPTSYIQKMLKRLAQFEAELRLKEKYLIVDDRIADFNKMYHDAQDWAHIKIHGSLQNQTAGQIYQHRRVTKIKNQLYLSGAGDVGENLPNLKYFVSGRFRYDAVFKFNDHYSKSVESDEKVEIELRDTYVDYSLGDVDFRLGKQQIVWGEAVGLFYADVVNARDLREYILPDFEFIRIPEFGVSSEFTKNDFHSQLVWLPGVEFDKTGLYTSEFAFPLPLPNNMTPFTITDPKEPGQKIENSKIGGRMSYLFGGLDVGAFYLHSWTSVPVMYRAINAGVYEFTPDYERQNIFGGTFSKEINDYVCKGEAVYYPDAYFSVNDPGDVDGVKKSGYVDYLVGVDHTYFNKWDVNVQLTQRWIMDYESTFYGEEEFSNGFSLRLSRNWLSTKLTTEAMVIVNLAGPDYLYRPRIGYAVTDNFKVAAGVDVLAGDPSGLYGYFRDKSRWYTEVTYKF